MEIPRPIPGWIPSTPDVRGPTISEPTRQHPVVAIHFWAEWDGYDRLLDRSIQAIRGRFEGRAHFVSCNTDFPENVELCRSFGIATIPALGVIVASTRRRVIVGCHNPEELANEIEFRLREPAQKTWWAFGRR